MAIAPGGAGNTSASQLIASPVTYGTGGRGLGAYNTIVQLIMEVLIQLMVDNGAGNYAAGTGGANWWIRNSCN